MVVIKSNKVKNLVLVLGVVFVSCISSTREKTDPGETALEQLRANIDTLFNAEIGANEPGAAVLVAYNGEMIIGKGYGLRDVENTAPITKSTNMRMGSVSKQFTALTVLKLLDEGKLKLKDSVYTFLPIATFKDGTTIEQLINHTSGKMDAEEVFFTDWDRTKIAENKDILDWYSKENRTNTLPGEAYRYNNGIYEFIPCIVAHVSGQDFADFAKENIFNAAGMAKTNFFNLAEPIEIEERAFCYEKDSLGNWKKVDGHFLNGLLGAGGVYTSVTDYFHYDTALRDKAILSAATHDLIFRPSSTELVDGVKKHYAMGWGVTDSTAAHSGGWFGTNTYTKRYLNKPLTIAIFMNRNTLFDTDLIRKTDSLAVDYVNAIANFGSTK